MAGSRDLVAFVEALLRLLECYDCKTADRASSYMVATFGVWKMSLNMTKGQTQYLLGYFCLYHIIKEPGRFLLVKLIDRMQKIRKCFYAKSISLQYILIHTF